MGYPKIPLTYPLSKASLPPIFPKTVTDISMRHNAWDQEIINNGVKVLLQKALPCPNFVGMDEKVHPANCPYCGKDQYIYLPPQEVVCLIHSISDSKEFNIQSVLQIGEIYFTFPTIYNDQPIDISPYDRFTVYGVFCRMWGQFEFEDITKIHLLTQPVYDVESLVSVHSGVLKFWQKEQDFIIENEGIKFLDSTSVLPEDGEIFSIMYYTYPSYTIKRLSHDIRIAQVLEGDKKVTVRLPQSGIAVRDFLIKE